MPKKNIDLLPGTLEMLILKTLSKSSNHGYGIAQYIQRISDDALKIGEGSLYPALQRLLIADFVSAEWGISDTGRKVRVYTITSAGRKQLNQEQKDFNFLLTGIARVMEAK